MTSIGQAPAGPLSLVWKFRQGIASAFPGMWLVIANAMVKTTLDKSGRAADGSPTSPNCPRRNVRKPRHRTAVALHRTDPRVSRFQTSRGSSQHTEYVAEILIGQEVRPVGILLHAPVAAHFVGELHSSTPWWGVRRLSSKVSHAGLSPIGALCSEHEWPVASRPQYRVLKYAT